MKAWIIFVEMPRYDIANCIFTVTDVLSIFADEINVNSNGFRGGATRGNDRRFVPWQNIIRSLPLEPKYRDTEIIEK